MAPKLIKQLNWRFLLVRISVNALALAITALVVPKINLVDRSIWNWLLMAVMLGVLNALLKPILQFLTLQFIFVTYGLVIVLVNALILFLLSWLFPLRFEVGTFLWALLGGLVLGLLSSFLESLLGLTMPIVPEEAAVRRQLERQAQPIDWRAVMKREAAPTEQAPAIEHPDPDAQLAVPGVVDNRAEGAGAAVPADPEPVSDPKGEEDRS